MNDNIIEMLKEGFSTEELSEINKSGEQQLQTTAPSKSLYETIITQLNKNLKDTNYTLYNGYLCYKKVAQTGDAEYIHLVILYLTLQGKHSKTMVLIVKCCTISME
ncbi:hypothetical protein [Mesobacillus boroniphilus]|uniref:hypothetical protein n=1 Tax=Mesobacillus boroniphilus TaxID=308892 RepID=UPI00054EF87B|nr:hypothetical protein [Mesobacillus boroniphilus]